MPTVEKSCAKCGTKTKVEVPRDAAKDPNLIVYCEGDAPGGFVRYESGKPTDKILTFSQGTAPEED